MSRGARIAIFGAFTLATHGLIAIYSPEPSETLWLSLVAAAMAALAMILVRHAGLMLFAVLAPFAGLIWSGALLTLTKMGAVGLLTQSIALVFGGTLALFAAGDFARRMAGGSSADEAATADVRILLWPAVASLVSCIAIMALLGALGPQSAWTLEIGIAADTACVLASVLIFGFLSLPLFGYSEDFVARWNRAQEFRARLLEKAAIASQPRWALSLSGIELIFVALGIFGSKTMTAKSLFQPIIWPAMAAVALAAAFVIARNWRIALAVPLALLPAVTLFLWALVKLGLALDLALWTKLATALAALMFPLLLIGQRAAAHCREGDDFALAFRRALEEQGVAAVFSAALGTMIWVSTLAVHEPAAIAFAVLAVGAGAAAILFLLAFAGAIESVIPRRRSVEEFYRAL